MLILHSRHVEISEILEYVEISETHISAYTSATERTNLTTSTNLHPLSGVEFVTTVQDPEVSGLQGLLL